MKVSECMSADVRIARPEDTLQSAARAMSDIDAGFLPVGDKDELIGIVTDRDIAIRGVGAGCGPDTPVSQVMSAQVHCCFEDDDAEDVLQTMAEIQVRRLPVVNRDKRLVGVVSITDLAEGHDALAGEALDDIARPSDRNSQTV